MSRGRVSAGMYPPERQRAITDLLLAARSSRATVNEISDHLRVTTETVRRDLDVLERRGVLRRVRGGAELVASAPFEAALAARHAEQYEEKLAIARRLVARLTTTGVIMLDSGSMTWFCANAMPDVPVTVVTNSLPAAQALLRKSQITVIVLPGMVRGLTSATTDSTTSGRITGLTVDVAVLGVNGLSMARGLTTTNAEEAATKRRMLLAARQRILPVISGKIGRNSFCPFAAVNELDLVVTDSGADPDLVAELVEAGPEVDVVSPAPGPADRAVSDAEPADPMVRTAR